MTASHVPMYPATAYVHTVRVAVVGRERVDRPGRHDIESLRTHCAAVVSGMGQDFLARRVGRIWRCGPGAERVLPGVSILQRWRAAPMFRCCVADVRTFTSVRTYGGTLYLVRRSRRYHLPGRRKTPYGSADLPARTGSATAPWCTCKYGPDQELPSARADARKTYGSGRMTPQMMVQPLGRRGPALPNPTRGRSTCMPAPTSRRCPGVAIFRRREPGKIR